MMQRATEELRLGKSATMIMVYGLKGPTTLAYCRIDLANLLSDSFKGLVIHQSSSVGVQMLLAFRSPLSRSPLGRMTKWKLEKARLLAHL